MRSVTIPLNAPRYAIGLQEDFPGGECPSFYPLPNSTGGAMDAASAGEAPAAGRDAAAAPTHVHKRNGITDATVVGAYAPGAPRELGSFALTPGVAAGTVDHGEVPTTRVRSRGSRPRLASSESLAITLRRIVRGAGSRLRLSRT